MIFPVCYAVYYSFFSMKLGGVAKFVTFKNYIDILTDDEFLEALKFSLLYTVVTVSFQVLFGMLIALLMDNITKWRNSQLHRADPHCACFRDPLLVRDFYCAEESSGCVFHGF